MRLRPTLRRPVRSAKRLGSSRVSSRSVCALPSKPPQSAANSFSACSPLWPKGGWPRSWERQAASTRSGSQPRAAPSSRPTWAHPEGVGEPGAGEVVARRPDDLGLPGEPAQRRGVQDAGAVALERRPVGAGSSTSRNRSRSDSLYPAATAAIGADPTAARRPVSRQSPSGGRKRPYGANVPVTLAYQDTPLETSTRRSWSGSSRLASRRHPRRGVAAHQLADAPVGGRRCRPAALKCAGRPPQVTPAALPARRIGGPGMRRRISSGHQRARR